MKCVSNVTTKVYNWLVCCVLTVDLASVVGPELHPKKIKSLIGKNG